MSSDRQKLVKKLDKLCRQILLYRDALPFGMFRCISCKRLLPINNAQVGHYISRRHESVRWDLRNIHLQCISCNKWHSGNPVEYRKTLVEKYGEEEVDKLELFYQKTPHYSTFDLSLLVKEKYETLTFYKENFKREKD